MGLFFNLATFLGIAGLIYGWRSGSFREIATGNIKTFKVRIHTGLCIGSLILFLAAGIEGVIKEKAPLRYGKRDEVIEKAKKSP